MPSLPPRVRSAAGLGLALVLISVLAGWLALLVTPAQSVSAAGQTLRVGATSPTFAVSGPGELDLFGQAIPTKLRFPGPIRPRLQLTHISIDSQLTTFMQTANKSRTKNDLSARLVQGWRQYFLWQSAVTVGFAVLLTLAFAGIRHYAQRKTLKLIGAGIAVALLVNAGAVVAFATGTAGTLRQVRSLDDLVGNGVPGAAPEPVGAMRPGVHAVVIGDSTAAGLGNPAMAHPSADDSACRRSADSYAADLAAVNSWNVLNLACSGATVSAGLLGMQTAGGRIVPPQFGVLEQANHAGVVVVSIGANDLQWHTMAALCAGAAACDDPASTAYFQTNLATFTRDFYELLHDLAALPGHPNVLINNYFSPFGSDVSCLSAKGFTPAKTKVLLSRLAALNTTLAQGARTFGFTDVRPRFDGHELCTNQPYVQGLRDAAPLHPNAAGELAIALADQQALASLAASNEAAAPSANPTGA